MSKPKNKQASESAERLLKFLVGTPMKITYHRDGTVTLWDPYRQQWDRTDSPSDEVLAALLPDDRNRVIRHTEAHRDAEEDWE